MFPPCEVIKLYDMGNGQYYCEPPGGNYVIDGKRVSITNISWKQNQRVTFNGLPSEFKGVTESIVPRHYVNDAGLQMDASEYKEKMANYNSLKDDIEREYHTSKLKRDWHQINEKVFTYYKIEFDVVPSVEPVNEHIIPLRAVNGNPTDTMMVYLRRQHIFDRVTRLFKEKGYDIVVEKNGRPSNQKYLFFDWDEEKDGIPSLKFSKIRDGKGGESYLTIVVGGLKKYEDVKPEYTGTKETTTEEYNRIDESIRKSVSLFLYNNRDLTDVEIKYTLAAVEQSIVSINNIVPMKKSSADKTAALKKLNSLAESLRKIMIDGS